MALIDCPECGTQVSSAAPSCPKCGFPVAQEVKRSLRKGRFDDAAATAGVDLSEYEEPTVPPPLRESERGLRISNQAPPRASAPEVQTIEQTGKFWKALQLVGALLFLGTCGSRCVVDRSVPDDGPWVYWLLGGAALYIFAKVGGWWKHG